MKSIFIYISCLILLSGCLQNKNTHSTTASDFFQARNSMEFKKIKNFISDSLTVIEGDYIMPYSQESYYEVFKWDSIFQTTYKIVQIDEIEDQIIASIELSSIRNKFLMNDKMTCKFKLSFESEKISKIESLDCQNVNWEIWQMRVNELVEWINVNHPELNGFINDMTLNGAKNYLKAIKLYESNLNQNNSIKK